MDADTVGVEVPLPQRALLAELDALLEFPTEAACISSARKRGCAADDERARLVLPEFLSESDVAAPAHPEPLASACSRPGVQQSFVVILDAIGALRSPLRAALLSLRAVAQHVEQLIRNRLVVAHVVPFACGIMVGGIAVLVMGGAFGARTGPQSLPGASAAAHAPFSLESPVSSLPLRQFSASSRLGPSQQRRFDDILAPDAASTSRQPRVFQGSLRIESRPQGAIVYLNDMAAGTTPLTLPALRVGSRAVRLELEGYQRWSTAVQIVTGQRTRLTADLSQLPK